MVERTGDLDCNPYRLVNGELSRAVEPVAQRFPVDLRHHVVQRARGLARVEEGKNVRMTEPRREADLAEEAFRAERLADIGAQDLDGDLAVMPEIVREINRGHAARAELALEAVPVGERHSQLLHQGGGCIEGHCQRTAGWTCVKVPGTEEIAPARRYATGGKAPYLKSDKRWMSSSALHRPEV